MKREHGAHEPGFRPDVTPLSYRDFLFQLLDSVALICQATRRWCHVSHDCFNGSAHTFVLHQLKFSCRHDPPRTWRLGKTMFLVSICRLGILEPAVELRHWRYFVAVAEMENVSRAALKLHVSQPALSRQIRDLEDEIGFCLLERTAKSVRLTDAGRAFLSDARALLQQADEAVKRARAIAGARTH